MDAAMTTTTFPLWVYAGLGYLGITLCGFGYLNAQHIATTAPTIIQNTPLLSESLKKSKIDYTRSGHAITVVTADVMSILRLLQKSQIQLTRCQITANTKDYTMTLEAKH